MEFLSHIPDFLIHFDKYLDIIIKNFGVWTYALLFLIVFCETGLVVTPFLPGDSLLFVVGAFAAMGSLDVWLASLVLTVAAILGDTANYAIGKYFGAKLSQSKHIPFFKKEYLDKTHQFYEKYGGKTIVIARFDPIVRTFAPFVAGLGTMSYLKFFSYNVIGGLVWVLLLVGAGYFFGNLPVVKENFTLVVYIIIVVSILPGVFEFWKARKAAANTKHH